MEIKQLKTFVAVVEDKSFTKASEKMYLTQPTVSFHIRSLENELQTQLVVRSTKKVEITERGLELYEVAKRIIAIEEGFFERCKDTDKEIVRIGASATLSSHILPNLLPKFLLKFPKAHFAVEQCDSDVVLEGLVDEKYDVGIVSTQSAKSAYINFTRLCEDKMVLITPNTKEYKRFGKLACVPAEEIQKLPFIVRGDNSATVKVIKNIFSKLELSEAAMNIVAKINNQESIKQLVSTGLGVSIISERAVKSYIAENRLLSYNLPIENSNVFYLAYRKSKSMPKIAQNFVYFAEQYYNAK